MTRELRRLNPGIFSALPKEFLSNNKNPCWFEKVHGTDVGSRWRERLSDNGTGHFRLTLRCLPYFYIIGMPKCGTSDLYYRITQHPDVVRARRKEPEWWTKGHHQHFELIHHSFSFFNITPLDNHGSLLGEYLDYFGEAAWTIQFQKELTSSGQKVTHDVITGEASTSTIFYNDNWREELWDTPNNEPPILIADLIRAVQPNAKFILTLRNPTERNPTESKFILTLRNPTERLYSDYLFWKFLYVKRSNEDFHARVILSLRIFRQCLRNNSVRSCAYGVSETEDPTAGTVRLRRGLYEVFLRDWLSIFPRDQILVQRLEDHSKDPNTTMTRVLNFLDLGPVRKRADKDAIFGFHTKNSQKKHYDSSGQMLPETRRILNEFYRPYNERLAELLNNTHFLWQKNSSV
ncbi:carbohydrate sulfotransferase 15-like [Branchiostoma floridae]|uniref:Sulfotransferase n=1 Tax=Branchiostoma floridae TaxID=7739 RepID=A0A9J7LN13_BRAFL|nr:carbohydrate sulfotransferase 15-like [Branchiostoma floridae]